MDNYCLSKLVQAVRAQMRSTMKVPNTGFEPTTGQLKLGVFTNAPMAENGEARSYMEEPDLISVAMTVVTGCNRKSITPYRLQHLELLGKYFMTDL